MSLSSSRVGLMSNSKWYKLFMVAAQSYPPLKGVRWQFSFNDNPVTEGLNVADCLIEGHSRFDDCWPFPCIELRDIEWIFIPYVYSPQGGSGNRPPFDQTNEVMMFIRALRLIGQFPLILNEDGVTITGYQ